jgi:alanyl-tRNA synthetase
MRAQTGSEIREAFLSFYEARDHTRLPSSSLVPDDPSVLLTIAGMLQFKPVFLGQAERKVPRATTAQKCVRTNDIENVGITARHHTFFEMLGNFSFGDYFKREAIEYAWELAVETFGLPPERIWVSVYEDDDEAFTLWRDLGVPLHRIVRMGAADNFWASGPTGPCGPCSELYYDLHPDRSSEGATLEDDSRFIEFYNLVFMEQSRGADGSLTPLAAKNIDTGMGLERMAQILQGVPNNYETDLIFPIITKAAELAGIDYATADEATKTALKVIGDHTRALVYLVTDGVTPSNVGRGYIVRRLLRRVVMKGRQLGIHETFTPTVAAVAIALSGDCDPRVALAEAHIMDVLKAEETTFSSTLKRGSKHLQEMLDAASTFELSGKQAFLLYDTFGFPLELTQELAEKHGIKVDRVGFDAEIAAQRTRSKAASILA